MAEVRLIIGTRHYVVACSDGEEAHLYNLGRIVAEKVKEAEETAGGLNESRSLLFASLLLADALAEKGGGKTANPAAPNSDIPDPKIMDEMAAIVEKLASRVESVADRLEQDG